MDVENPGELFQVLLNNPASRISAGELFYRANSKEESQLSYLMADTGISITFEVLVPGHWCKETIIAGNNFFLLTLLQRRRRMESKGAGANKGGNQCN